MRRARRTRLASSRRAATKHLSSTSSRRCVTLSSWRRPGPAADRALPSSAAYAAGPAVRLVVGRDPPGCDERWRHAACLDGRRASPACWLDSMSSEQCVRSLCWQMSDHLLPTSSSSPSISTLHHIAELITENKQHCTLPSTLCPKKTCDYIFYNNFNSKCPITIIFGIVSSNSMRHRKMVSFPTSPI